MTNPPPRAPPNHTHLPTKKKIPQKQTRPSHSGSHWNPTGLVVVVPSEQTGLMRSLGEGNGGQGQEVFAQCFASRWNCSFWV